MALMLTGDSNGARTLYAQCPSPSSEDGYGGGSELFVDDCVVRFGMGLYGGESIGSDWMADVSRDIERLSSTRLDSTTRGHLEYALAVQQFLLGDFDSALERLAAVRTLLRGSSYVAFYGEVLHAQVDFCSIPWR